jgi:hypothetical protein
MRRSFLIAAFVAALAVAPLWAQMRGGHGGFTAGHPGFSTGSFGFTSARVGFTPSTNFFFNGGFRFGHNPRSNFFFNRSPFFSGHRRYNYSSYYGGYYYPYYSYPYTVVQSEPSTYYPDEYYEQRGLRRDIDVLTGKVDRLQESLESRRPVAHEAPKPAEPQPSTILIFKDQHTREVTNYAIVGGTVWVLNEERADKIPLSDLDLEATTKFNDERGVGFQAPH